MKLVNLLFLGLLLVFVTKVAPHQGCPRGFEKINTECKDEDECKEERCGANATCLNTNGSYYCTCVPGYQTKTKNINFTTGECRDINECTEDSTICGSNAVCYNTGGSYYCTCASGFNPSNGQKTFNASQGVTCKDIDECKDKTICGPNAKCYNLVGSFNCMCDSGFKSSNGQKAFKANQGVKCEDVCTDGASLCGEGGVCKRAADVHECECKAGFTNYGFKNISCTKLECDSLLSENIAAQIPEQLKRIVPELQSSCAKLNRDMSGDSGRLTPEELLEMLLDAIDYLLSDKPMNTNEKVTAFFEIVENALKMIGPVLEKHCNRSTNYTQLEILVSRGAASPQAPLTMYTDNVQLDSRWETAAGDKYLGFATVALLSYRGLNKSVNDYFDWIKKQEDQNIQVNSEVVTISVTNPKPIHLEKPVTLTFSHLQHQPPEANVSCAFWNSSLGGGAWSTSGCTLVKSNWSHTVCSCTHLSSFAVLMALYEQESPFELQLITWVGLSLSMICLLICILTFHFVHSIKSTRTTIHLHLCISLFIADLIFLAGISQTENKVGCAFVAGMLHFFFLAVFCWMLLEGLQLFRMVVLVFNTTVNSYYLMAAGYGVPALIVTISAIINAKGYGTTRHCWLSLENGFIWSFFGPVCVIIVVNVFFFLITVWKLAEKFSSLNPDFNKLRKFKTFTITAIAQLCVLGTMWIFGCFQFDESTLVMSYIFTILNSLQGVLVFLMHCLLVKQVREVYANSLWNMCRPQKRKYDEFSTNQSSKSQGSKSSHNTGESQI